MKATLGRWTVERYSLPEYGLCLCLYRAAGANFLVDEPAETGVRVAFNVAEAIKLIDFVDEITGIWGTRPGSTHGTHQFRLSVKWRKGLVQELSTSECFSRDVDGLGHIIRLNKPGDDADLHHTPIVTEEGPVSYRAMAQSCGTIQNLKVVACHGVAPAPLWLQVNFLEEDQTTGEFDIDFDFLNSTHLAPSNSDPLAETRGHRHLDMLNQHFAFERPLSLSCNDAGYNHGRESYDPKKNCIIK